LTVDVHEYQAKELLARYGVPVPRGSVADSAEQATSRARELGGSAWVVKAQVHAGGRGEAGGVRLCANDREINEAASQLLGRRLVTRQSGPQGRLIHRLYVEEASAVARELYFGILVHRSFEGIMVAGSRAGGMEIEDLVESGSDAMVTILVDPDVGLLEFQARALAFALDVPGALVPQAVHLFRGAYRAFRDLDASMVEINPLAITADGELLALDAKMSFDDNALFRHPDIAALRDRSQEDAREIHATDQGLAYVGLDGDIGCVINGAGLAMATLDMIKLAGGEPANFLDIGGGASPRRVLEAFRAVLNDERVAAMLVNIFAGINRCDWVAQGVVDAFAAVDVRIPVVVRLAGAYAEEGRAIFAASGLPIRTADTLAEAAELAVAAARSGVVTVR
jgi:malate-CoA ligase subunit beta